MFPFHYYFYFLFEIVGQVIFDKFICFNLNFLPFIEIEMNSFNKIDTPISKTNTHSTLKIHKNIIIQFNNDWLIFSLYAYYALHVCICIMYNKLDW